MFTAKNAPDIGVSSDLVWSRYIVLWKCIFVAMNSVHQIFAVVHKDARLELRRGYALGGLLVFVLCTVFVIYLAVPEFPAPLWVALYWVAFLFLSIHTVLKSFAQESATRFIYYYTLLRPETLFLSKCLYNTLVLSGLGLVMYAALALTCGHPIVNTGLFIGTICAGGLSISLCFTFISGIAIKSDHGATLMTILSFPVVIPVLLNLVRLSEQALQRPGTADPSQYFTMLGAIDLILIAMGLLLFPYLWKS